MYKLIFAVLHLSLCQVGARCQLTCRPCLSHTSGGISWTTVVLRGFTQQLSSGLSSGRTRQYTFTNHKISYISSDSFQCTALSVVFAIIKFLLFSLPFSLEKIQYAKMILLRETQKITKTQFLQRKKVTNLSYLHKILRQVKNPH